MNFETGLSLLLLRSSSVSEPLDEEHLGLEFVFPAVT